VRLTFHTSSCHVSPPFLAELVTCRHASAHIDGGRLAQTRSAVLHRHHFRLAVWLAKRHWTCSLKRLYRLAAQVEVGFKLEDQHGPAADWIALDPVQRSISKRFRNFLLAFQAETDGPRHYLEAILRMCRGALRIRFISSGALERGN